MESTSGEDKVENCCRRSLEMEDEVDKRDCLFCFFIDRSNSNKLTFDELVCQGLFRSEDGVSRGIKSPENPFLLFFESYELTRSRKLNFLGVSVVVTGVCGRDEEESLDALVFFLTVL